MAAILDRAPNRQHQDGHIGQQHHGSARERAKTGFVRPDVPHATKFDGGEPQHAPWMVAGPADCATAKLVIQTKLECGMWVDVGLGIDRFRIVGPGAELLCDRRHEIHIAAAIGLGTDSVVQTGADLERRGHKPSVKPCVADPPGRHGNHETYQQEQRRHGVAAPVGCERQCHDQRERHEQQPAGANQGRDSCHKSDTE